jgi:hypothetical protein
MFNAHGEKQTIRLSARRAAQTCFIASPSSELVSAYFILSLTLVSTAIIHLGIFFISILNLIITAFYLNSFF